ncbi:MAG: hypothetical protein ACYC6Y_22950 [Thermoguttaceae bacterium]
MAAAWIALLLLTSTLPAAETGTLKDGAAAGPEAETGDRAESPALETQTQGLPSAELRKRTGRELMAAVRETLARLADPKNEQLEAAVEELLFVYGELEADCSMAGSQREYYLKKVGLRLEQLGVELKKRIARNKRLAPPKVPEEIREAQADSLAQQGGVAAAGVPAAAGRAAAGPAVHPGAGAKKPPARPLMGRGPAGGTGRAMGGDDYGQHLVELIQKTVAPSSWDVNGGLGTIFYWRPGRALVVRQTGQVHDEMGGVLGQLRRAAQ